jgi:2-polyprenyl-3-methyl-5-hydroxy-6-metoxy-1,4-benzoquinol methylase
VSDPFNRPEYWNTIYIGEGFNTWRQYPETIRIIKEVLKEPVRIVELGGGPGVLAKELQDAGHAVVMLDHSEVAIAQAKRRGVELAVCADVPQVLEFHTADYVIATEFLEHFKNEDLREILRMSVIVAPNAIFAVPNNTLGPATHQEHHQQFTLDSFAELLSEFYERVRVRIYEDAWSANVGFHEKTYKVPTIIAHCEGRK